MIPPEWIIRSMRWGESAAAAARRARRRRLLALFAWLAVAGYLAGTLIAEVLS